mmetsp:Transcript_3441/g.9843  ORF Transcript_3441/g.9843 Transcript_3441/m.9843 type:complete len:253 (+) Transcript_3441:485-1243(+)
MLAARRRQEPSNKLLDAGVDVAAVEGARPDDGVRRAGPSRKIISLVGILLIQPPRARAGDDARLLVVVAGPRLRALELRGRWPSMLGLQPFEERAACGLAGLVAADRVQGALQSEGRGLRRPVLRAFKRDAHVSLCFGLQRLYQIALGRDGRAVDFYNSPVHDAVARRLDRAAVRVIYPSYFQGLIHRNAQRGARRELDVLAQARFGHPLGCFIFCAAALRTRLRYNPAAGSVFGLQPCRAAYLFSWLVFGF